jgi:hypothetical protein
MHFPLTIRFLWSGQDESSFLQLIGIYAQHNIFFHCNQQRKGEEHNKIYIQAKKWMKLVPSNL